MLTTTRLYDYSEQIYRKVTLEQFSSALVWYSLRVVFKKLILRTKSLGINRELK